MLKRKKKQPAETAVAENAVKVSVKNFGSGMLEFADNTIKFQVAKGSFKKQKETAIKIPIADVENVRQDGKELSITWNSITDTFTAEKPELLTVISEKITAAVNEQKKTSQDREMLEERTMQKRDEVTGLLSYSAKIADALFDILRSLQGRVDWNLAESGLNRAKESAVALADQKLGAANLNFKKLSSALGTRVPEQVAQETYNVLKVLQEHFNAIGSDNAQPEQEHPNLQDAKTVMQAYLVLNDIALGAVVGDEEIAKEGKELAKLLDTLSKETNVKIDSAAVKAAVNKLGMTKGNEKAVEEARALFMQQLKELAAPQTQNPPAL